MLSPFCCIDRPPLVSFVILYVVPPLGVWPLFLVLWGRMSIGLSCLGTCASFIGFLLFLTVHWSLVVSGAAVDFFAVFVWWPSFFQLVPPSLLNCKEELAWALLSCYWCYLPVVRSPFVVWLGLITCSLWSVVLS